jgi:tetratricopeptide (TPR) repeat protein
MSESWFVPHLENASGHYRLLSGYDDAASASTRGVGLTVQYVDTYPSSEKGFFIARDSYTGPNTKLPYVAFDLDWRVFNRTYIVAYTDAQASAVKAIVGDNMDDATMYARAHEVAQREMALNGNDPYAWFNLGSSLVGLGKYEEAANAFDKARVLKLPWRMMWYQFGPYEAYYHAARYREVIALADATLASSAGLEESLYYRGLAQLALGQKDAARASFQRALQSNPHFAPAKQALAGMGG